MRLSKRVRLTNKLTGEVNVYESPQEAAEKTGYKYITVIAWLNNRITNRIYKAEYIDDEYEH